MTELFLFALPLALNRDWIKASYFGVKTVVSRRPFLFPRPALLYRVMKRSLGMLLLLLAAACGRAPHAAPPPAPQQDVIARVDDRVLTLEDMRAIDPTGTLTADEVRTVAGNWAERELLLKVAAELGVAADTRVAREIEEARSRVILEALGERIRRDIPDDTGAKRFLRGKVKEMREKSRVEIYPWRMR